MHENHFFHVSLKLILKNKEGEILLLKMPDTSTMAGYYDLLGGRISTGKHGVPFIESIRREVEEEVGSSFEFEIDERPVSYGIHTVPSGPTRKEVQILMLFFEAKYIKGEIKLSEEHKEYAWLDITEQNLKKYFVRGLLQGMSSYFKFKEK